MMLVPLDRTDPAWADLVAGNPEATAFHHPAWTSVLADTYGYRSVLMAEPGLAAGVVLARVPRLRGWAWISLPFSDHCLPLARDAASLRRLAGGLAGWAAAERTSIEVRGRLPAARAWSDAAIGVRHVLALGGDPEVLRAGLDRSVRRRLRQGERSGLEVRFGTSVDDVADFYRLQVATRRRHGVPVQPRRFFDAIRRHLLEPGLGAVVLAAPRGGRPVAAALVLAWNGIAIFKYQASDACAWDLHPNHAIYWATIRWAREAGCGRLDLGRTETRHDGLREWKTAWGAEEMPLSYSRTGGGAPTLDRGRVGAALGHVIRHSPAVVCRGVGALLYRYAA